MIVTRYIKSTSIRDLIFILSLMRHNIIELDIIRALAIILIVFCHLHYFINSEFLEKWSSFPFAFLGLNFFFILSGFLMNYKRKIKSKDDITVFVIKRVKRIYPLYWIALILSMVMNLLSIYPLDDTIQKTELVLLNMLGLQGLFPEEYTIYGMWFIGVIILYYIIYVFIAYYSDNINGILINSFIVIIPLLVLKHEFGLIHVNTFNFYPAFIAGILSSEVKDFKDLSRISVYSFLILLLFSGMSCLGLMTIKNVLVAAIYIIFSIISLFVAIYYASSNYSKEIVNILPNDIYQSIYRIAYSSYSIFLFHTMILRLLTSVLYTIGIHSGVLYTFLILFLGMPLIFSIAYYIQKMSTHRIIFKTKGNLR